MSLRFCKLSFSRTAILLSFFVILAGQMLGLLLIISATAVPSYPQASPQAPGSARGVDAQAQSAVQLSNGPEGRQRLSRAQSDEEHPPSASRTQKSDLLKYRFEKMKHDAGELADLAKDLQEGLNKSNENILSLDVIDKVDKIQKLAKKIKGAARGF